MKERLLLAISWGALGWACLVLVVIAEALNAGRDMYLILTDPLIYISPAIWLVVWIVTGNPRILPWKKVTEDD